MQFFIKFLFGFKNSMCWYYEVLTWLILMRKSGQVHTFLTHIFIEFLFGFKNSMCWYYEVLTWLILMRKSSQVHTFLMHIFAFWGWKVLCFKVMRYWHDWFPPILYMSSAEVSSETTLTEARCWTGFGWNLGFAQRAVLALCQILQWTRARVTHDL